MEPPQPSDEALLTQYRLAPAHTRRSIADVLFSRHYERVARWCYRLTGDREAAADLAQDVFLKAHRHLEVFKGSSRFTTWLYAIVRNEALNRVKRKPPGQIDDPDDVLVAVPSLNPGPEELAAAESRVRRLHAFLSDTLDDTERYVFTMHYGDDLSLDAITRVLRLSNPSGAKAYIVSARRKLARAVKRLNARGERL